MGERRRLYKMGHAGEITWQEAGAASRVLRELRFCIEGGQIEQRIGRLEEALDEHDAARRGGHRPNGHDDSRARRP
jgi:hypothetical protein